MKMTLSALLLFCALPLSVFASELDPKSNSLPQTLIVRVSEDGQREVFRTNTAVNDLVNSEASITELTTDQNKIDRIAPISELDRPSSTSKASWCWGGQYNDVYSYTSGVTYYTPVYYYQYGPWYSYGHYTYYYYYQRY